MPQDEGKFRPLEPWEQDYTEAGPTSGGLTPYTSRVPEPWERDYRQPDTDGEALKPPPIASMLPGGELIHRFGADLLRRLGQLTPTGISPRTELFAQALRKSMIETGAQPPLSPEEQERFTIRERVAKLELDPEYLELVEEYERRAFGFYGGPAETTTERVVEAAAGLAAFILRLRYIGRAFRPLVGRLPARIQAPVIWEIENQAGGGDPGHGAAMAFGLQMINRLPIRTPLKVAAESVGFGGLTALQGGDEVDIYINMAIPGTLRGINKIALAAKLRGASTKGEVSRVMWEIERAGQRYRFENNLPEDYMPDPQTVMGLARNQVAQMSPRQRAQSAKNRATFRDLTGEIVRASTPGKEPVTLIQGRPTETVAPLTGRVADPLARPTTAPAVRERMGGAPGVPAQPPLGAKMGAAPETPILKAKPMQKSKLDELLATLGIDPQRRARVIGRKNATERLAAVQDLLERAEDQLESFQTELGSKPEVIEKQRQRVVGLQMLVGMMSKRTEPVVSIEEEPPGRRPSVTRTPAQIRALQREIADEQALMIADEAQVAPTERVQPVQPVRVIKPLPPPPEGVKPLVVEPGVEVSRVEPSRPPTEVTDFTLTDVTRPLRGPSGELVFQPRRILVEDPAGETVGTLDVTYSSSAKELSWGFEGPRRPSNKQLETIFTQLRAKFYPEAETARGVITGPTGKETFIDTKIEPSFEVGQKSAAVSDLLSIERVMPGTKGESFVRAAEADLRAGKKREVEVTLTDTGPLVTDGRSTLEAARNLGMEQIPVRVVSEGRPLPFIPPGGQAVSPAPYGRARLAGDTPRIKVEYPVYADLKRAETLARQVNKRNLFRDEPQVKVVPVEGGFTLEAVDSPVIARVGVKGEPVLENDVVEEAVRFFPSRPKRYSQPRAEYRFFEDLDNNRVPVSVKQKFLEDRGKDADSHREEFWDWLVTEGRVKVLEEPTDPKARKKLGLPTYTFKQGGQWVTTPDGKRQYVPIMESKGREVPESTAVTTTIKGRKVWTGEPVSILGEPDPVIAAQREWLSDQLARMKPKDREILARLRGLLGYEPEATPRQGAPGREGQTPNEIAKAMNIPVKEVRASIDRIMLDLRKASGQEPPDMTVEQQARRSLPPSHRRGFFMLPPISDPITLTRRVGKELRMAVSQFWSLETRDMIDAVERSGGLRGRDLGVILRRVVDSQLDYMGRFQVESEVSLGQLREQKLINKFRNDAWNMQHQGYPASHEVPVRRGGWTVAERFWTTDRMPDLVEGLIRPETPGERHIVQVLRGAARATGRLLEEPQIGFQMQRRDRITIDPKTGKTDWIEGEMQPFKRTPRGRIFVNMVTPEAYDIIMRGPKDDGLYERMVAAYAAANPYMKVPRRHTVESYTRKIFDERIRAPLIDTNPRTGFRRIGPELERWFQRRPTGILSKGRYNKRTGEFVDQQHIQLLITEPRKYLDALYSSTAVRAGFAQHLGQDGKIIERLRNRYVIPKGNELTVDNWVFTQAIRTLSNLPPAITEGSIPKIHKRGPADLGYRFARYMSAGQDVIKQVLLTATAPVQISEPLGFAIVPKFYWPMMRGLKDLYLSGPKGRKAVLWELERHRMITKDIINMSLDRSLGKLSTIQRMSAVMSRLHLNKFANEALNEQPAALYGRAIIQDIAHRHRPGSLAPVRENDVYFFRLLDYGPRDALNLAAGNATKADYAAAARRATRFFVGSTAISPQKSPWRNTRLYRFLIPFTSYFSNRARMLDRHVGVMMDTFKGASTRHTTTWGKLMDGPSWRAAGRLGKFLVGVEAAGIFASFIWAGLREGDIGIKLRARQVKVGIEQILEDPLAWEGYRKVLKFLGDSFVFGTFGPVYGAFYDIMLRAANVEGEPAEQLAVRASRVFLPVSLFWDVLDAVRGTGPYRDRDKVERFSRFVKIHFPIMHTLPFEATASMLGFHLEDPRVTAARKAVWNWRMQPANKAIPSKTTRYPSREANERAYNMHMRRAKEAHFKGLNPNPHIRQAIKAMGVEGYDPATRIRNWMLMQDSALTDAHIKKMERDLGPEIIQIVRDHDKGLARLANAWEEVSKIGRELEAEHREKVNVKKNLYNEYLRDLPPE